MIRFPRLATLVASLATTVALTSVLPAARAADAPVLNLYSARHYETDDVIYKAFTDQTGIEVRLIEGKDAALIERIRAEGANSPADVLLLADASRLWSAEQEGVFAPVDSALLNERIPAHLRGADQGKGSAWFGFSTRARVIIVDPTRVDPAAITSYADLAKPGFRDMVCTRSGSHPYMLSLIGSIATHDGPEAAEQWASGVVENFARKPRGGDTDQIRAVAIGECGIALSNSYYYFRLARSDKPEDKAVIEATRLVWPNQDGVGTHVNVSGGGMAANAPHPDAAKAFLEFLSGEQAQRLFAEGNNEWPVVPGTPIDVPIVAEAAGFKADPLPISEIGASQVEAVRIIDRVGWR